MCLFPKENLRLSESIAAKLSSIQQRLICFGNNQQLKELSKDEYHRYTNVRLACVQYIKASCTRFHTKPDTFATAVNALDVFLWKVKVTERHMSIVAAACFFIAAKMMESEEERPSGRRVSERQEWTRKDLRRMELYVLEKLGWCVLCVTYLDFLPLVALACGVSVSLVCSPAVISLAEKFLSRETTVLMKPGVLALSLLHLVTARTAHSPLDYQVLVHCNIPESEVHGCLNILSLMSPPSSPVTCSRPRSRLPLKIFERPSELGSTCLPTITEEPTTIC